MSDRRRMQAIKDSEFRAANDDGEPATDLVGVGPSSYSPPDVVRITVEDEEFGEDFTVKVTIPDLIAAIQAGVESGTIKGEEVEWCETHWCTARDERPGGNPGMRYCYLAEQLKVRNVEPFGVCEIVPRLVIEPVSDGGSET